VDLFHFRQRARILKGVPADCDRNIIAAMLAFEAHLLAHPPHRGMVEQHRLDHGLEEVYKVVLPADMSQFVGQERSNLGLVQARECSDGQKNIRPEPADRGWNPDHGGCTQANGRGNTES
jgi:hypothetical protein